MRIEGWEERLGEFIRKTVDIPFKWGTTDCCTFAADCILLTCGKDLVGAFRNTYTNEAAAKASLNINGKGSLRLTVSAVAINAGLTEIKIAYAQRGDLVYMIAHGQPAIGIIDLSARMILGRSEQGIIQMPLTTARQIWRVE